MSGGMDRDPMKPRSEEDEGVVLNLEEKDALLPLDMTGDAEVDAMLRDCIDTMSSKGQEYTGGSPDRLNNFRQAGLDVGLPMEKVWYVFFNKHLRALQSYIKNGCVVKSNETIHSRIMDCIVYLLLFEKMSREIERTRENEKRF
jgi:hypothetical protein